MRGPGPASGRRRFGSPAREQGVRRLRRVKPNATVTSIFAVAVPVEFDGRSRASPPTGGTAEPEACAGMSVADRYGAGSCGSSVPEIPVRRPFWTPGWLKIVRQGVLPWVRVGSGSRNRIDCRGKPRNFRLDLVLAVADIQFTSKSPRTDPITLGQQCETQNRSLLLAPGILGSPSRPRWRRIRLKLIEEGFAHRNCTFVDRLSPRCICPRLIRAGMRREAIRAPDLPFDLLSRRASGGQEALASRMEVIPYGHRQPVKLPQCRGPDEHHSQSKGAVVISLTDWSGEDAKPRAQLGVPPIFFYARQSGGCPVGLLSRCSRLISSPRSHSSCSNRADGPYGCPGVHLSGS